MTIYIDRRLLSNAIYICNCVGGTFDVARIVEQQCLARPEKVYHNQTGHQLVYVDKAKQWWMDCAEVGNMLDEQGRYWYEGDYLTHAKSIAEAIRLEGFTWVKRDHVVAAQKRKVKVYTIVE